ncbi:tRNA uridine-5-carboxymethylaminomethyl(34) synthesis GTPase MnmE [Ruminococcus albus]|uniref:tRNA modification GTPase MnmE n=1 Tax=Ruminococcus albus 8 TaxID=246199 RepID=E9S9R6_RUMAL|nr:tRNA uridine-5-carboxymethylaminomethyl(34) synthesis GTPase MnmE [Ruminococcus albus]EGC03957.1 tRNA modification GTPase TrmE [Ruminococcus albus 8]MCC3350387.1 tRNA uridine-5-carboxymethylaminomethyl(34) synthesis GTPase MnmE [Ruminococcus albus 8]
MSTICAISTPVAEGGISVIRISGENALNVAEKIFAPHTCPSVAGMAGYTCAYGQINDNGRAVDDGVLTVFRAPHSYTGEDVCEISCHGGIYVTKRVLRLCLENGAEPAQAGEFTKRAMLNGKLSLTQAEAVMDTIAAQGEYALASANLTRKGSLFGRIDKVTKELVKLLGELAAWVDYPEEDLPAVEENALRESLKNAVSVTGRLLADSDNGMLIKNGIDTVIAGRPNVGKSTLMNLLLGYDRSIVTEVAGTTRDVIEESARLGELIFRLSDTAGIRDTEDKVEKIGVEMAQKRLEECMLVIEVFDTSVKPDDDDTALLEKVRSLGKRALIVLNKSDLESAVGEDFFREYCENIVCISAKDPNDREKIQHALEKIFTPENYDADSTIFANERQRGCLVKANKNLTAALEALEMGETLDAVTVMIDYAADSLLELTGEKATEAVVSEVFSKFCVGK